MTFVILAAAAVLILLAGSYGAYRYVFYFRDTRTEQEIMSVPEEEQYQREKEQIARLADEMKALPYEEVFITSFDGKKLAGKYYHVREGAPLQIQMHGYKSAGIRDFCGGNKVARQLGMNTLVVDQRAHGKSEGRTLTFGVLERFDCQSWANYAYERFGKDTPVFLAGVSMGAATVLMTADLPLPQSVKGIIADCPYSSPKEIICLVGKGLHLPVNLIYPFVYLGAALYGQFHLTKTSAVQAVGNTKLPILLIHGEDDRFVPCYMSSKIKDACRGPVTFETFPDAGHAISYLLDNDRYYSVVKKFTEGCLKGTV